MASDEPIPIESLAALFAEMTETRAWREFVKVLDAHIRDREKLIMAPLSELQLPMMQSADMTAKMIALESVKGALIGLKLARAIPSTTIQQARDERREEENEND